MEKIIEDISRLLEETPTRVSCHQATRLLARKNGLKMRQAVGFLHRLVNDGYFRYVYDSGQSFLEKDYTTGVRLSERILLATHQNKTPLPDGLSLVKILPGAAFGDCRHPTTRLSVRVIDTVLSKNISEPGEKTALDIGTGSGILAITAAVLGIKRVLAIDIDPCARKEARENIIANDLQNRISVCNEPVDKIAERFNLIIGNMRPPTLIRYAKQISDKTKQNGLAVLSGAKVEECDNLLSVYTKAFDCLSTFSENGWCAMVLLKKG